MRTCFDEGNPVYRSNKATEWAKRCSRDAYISALNPGKMISIRGESPGPGHYKYKNMSCGSDTKKFTFRRRTLNLNGKFGRIVWLFFIIRTKTDVKVIVEHFLMTEIAVTTEIKVLSGIQTHVTVHDQNMNYL
jgi:hypothetical protein